MNKHARRTQQNRSIAAALRRAHAAGTPAQRRARAENAFQRALQAIGRRGSGPA